MTVQLTVCDAGDRCTALERVGPVREPASALAALLGDTTALLARVPSERAALSWSTPQSADPYAVRVLGRAAAAVYGLTPVSDTALGSVRRDPVARAAFLDPDMPLAQWLVARREHSQGGAFAAVSALSGALPRDPTSVALLSGRADALALLGRADEAAATWTEVDRLAPRDPRFAVPRASAQLAAGNAAAAVRIVAEFPASYHADPGMAALRVDLADHGALDDDLDALLAVWERADPHAIDPVRRRIVARLVDGDTAGADAMLAEYAARADPRASAQMRLAVAVASAQWDRALVAATDLEDDATARAIRARAALGTGSAPGQADSASDPYELALYAQIALQRGDAAAALRYADRALARKSVLPEALAIRWSALVVLGRSEAAQATLARLKFVDPRWARTLADQEP